MGMLIYGGFPVFPLKENNGRKVLVFFFSLLFFLKFFSTKTVGNFLRRF